MKNTAEVKAFGIHLRKLREKHDLSQQELADMADISKMTIQRIENAKYTATLDVLISLSKALRIPLHDLVNFKSKRN